KAGDAVRADLTKIKVNNALRRVVRDVLGSLTLASDDAATRTSAAETLLQRPDPTAIDALDQAIAREQVPAVKDKLEAARAAAVLNSDFQASEKMAAITVIAARGGRDALSLLTAVAAKADGAVRDKAEAAIAGLEQSLAMWGMLQNVWYGLSLGSVLLLAAIGLAITFGVMGVINMAHGEMVMLGAYTTFVVQEYIRTSSPGLFDYSLVIAVPLAFVVAGLVGILIEQGIIRFLYGRPLETLLATWGLSLILQQAVRTAFGPTNREVGAPSWMSGTFSVGQINITYGR